MSLEGVKRERRFIATAEDMNQHVQNDRTREGKLIGKSTFYHRNDLPNPPPHSYITHDYLESRLRDVIDLMLQSQKRTSYPQQLDYINAMFNANTIPSTTPPNFRNPQL